MIYYQTLNLKKRNWNELPVHICVLYFPLLTLLNLMKIPDRFPPTVNTVTTKMTQRTRTYRDHWGAAEWIWTLSLYLSETKLGFLRRGHSCMEKKAGPNQVNRMLLSHHKRIILTLWPHQLWRMSFYSQSVISKDSLTLFNPQPRHHRYFYPRGQLLHLQNRIWALQLVAFFCIPAVNPSETKKEICKNI